MTPSDFDEILVVGWPPRRTARAKILDPGKIYFRSYGELKFFWTHLHGIWVF